MASRPDDHEQVTFDSTLAVAAIAAVVATIAIPLLLALFR